MLLATCLLVAAAAAAAENIPESGGVEYHVEADDVNVAFPYTEFPDPFDDIPGYYGEWDLAVYLEVSL